MRPGNFDCKSLNGGTKFKMVTAAFLSFVPIYGHVTLNFSQWSVVKSQPTVPQGVYLFSINIMFHLRKYAMHTVNWCWRKVSFVAYWHV